MKKFGFFVMYSFVLLLLGRSLYFLPQVDFRSGQEKTEDLKKNVSNKFLKNKNASYSIYYQNLKDSSEFGIYENKVSTAASLNKLLIVSYLYNLTGQGKINLDDKIVVQKEDIQDYGSGSIRNQEPGGSYSLKNLAKLSLEQSDNTASYVLSVKLEMKNIQNYGKNLGLKVTDMDNNKTSARDMGKILGLIYQSKIVKGSLRNELLDFMKDTDFEDRLPREIPSNVSVYHKTGDAIGMIHDAGIIDDGKNPFILVVLTSDVTNEDEAKKTIGQIAKFIFDQRG